MTRSQTVLVAFCGIAFSVSAAAQDAGFVRDVFVRINAQRTQHGLSRLTYNKTLEKAAQAHALFSPADRLNGRLKDGGKGSREARSASVSLKSA